MTSPAAPPEGCRPAFGTTFVVVAYLLVAPPLFLLMPLALLLAFGPPKSSREWLWFVLTAGLGGLKVLGDAAHPAVSVRLMTAVAITAGGVFVLLVYLKPRTSTLLRAAIAMTSGLAAAAIWARSAGIAMATIDAALAEDLKRGLEIGLRGAEPTQVAMMTEALPLMARAFPGVMFLLGMVGLALAWRWYHLIAAAPIGVTPRPLVEFRFNDHIIWGAIFTLALALFDVGGPVGRVITWATIIWGGVYALRGLAIVLRATQAWPVPGKLLVLIASILVLPMALGTLVMVGVADTWIDFRNRSIPTAGGGNEP
ncbi:MAG: DUF2232 domain-containing protein [Gemmatimonadales bacterium]